MLIKKVIISIVGGLLLVQFSNCIAGNQREISNKEIATRFFQAVVNEKSFSSAQQDLGDWYIEHDPQGHDGPSGLKEYIDFLNTSFPNSHVEIKRAFASGDFVIFHVHSKMIPSERGQAIVDIFRLEAGKVVEHWDVTQDIPQTAENPNGMF